MRTLLAPASKFPVLSDVALLISRVALGVILLAHGWQKFDEWTLDGTAAAFADMGIPAATAAATFTTFVEMIGGAALILGAFTPLVALLNIANLVGALALVHAANGVFVGDNGYELVLALAAGLLVIATLGAGKFSVDGLLGRSTNGTATDAPERRARVSA
jgi:putative oxidoreductase